jgi:hypothetical protein
VVSYTLSVTIAIGCALVQSAVKNLLESQHENSLYSKDHKSSQNPKLCVVIVNVVHRLENSEPEPGEPKPGSKTLSLSLDLNPGA